MSPRKFLKFVARILLQMGFKATEGKGSHFYSKKISELKGMCMDLTVDRTFVFSQTEQRYRFSVRLLYRDGGYQVAVTNSLKSFTNQVSFSKVDIPRLSVKTAKMVAAMAW